MAIVRGRVQGVGYRWFVQREASRLRLDGWVANRSDGGVEVVAEGAPDDLELLVATLREGPSGADVRDVEVGHEPARGDMAGFSIRTGAHRGD